VGPLDAAIPDLILPDGNGVDVCRAIRVGYRFAD
jgi:DNA-binding response OmpR family regulator